MKTAARGCLFGLGCFLTFFKFTIGSQAAAASIATADWIWRARSSPRGSAGLPAGSPDNTQLRQIVELLGRVMLLAENG